VIDQLAPGMETRWSLYLEMPELAVVVRSGLQVASSASQIQFRVMICLSVGQERELWTN
jgi:hypothetical protein